MKLEEGIDIKADASKVWSFVGDVTQWPHFVSKISKATRKDGNHFEIQHVKGPMVVELLDERIEKAIGVKLEIKGQEARITYALEERNGYCRVTEVQEFPMMFPLNLLILWIHKTGKKQGPSNLDCLKQIVESTF